MNKILKLLFSKKGFTLIELLVIVAILGVLAAISIPRMVKVTDRAILSEAQVSIDALRQSQELYFAESTSNVYTSKINKLYENVDENSLNSKDWAIDLWENGLRGASAEYEILFQHKSKHDLEALYSTLNEKVITDNNSSTDLVNDFSGVVTTVY